jgi:hypothetical protein
VSSSACQVARSTAAGRRGALVAAAGGLRCFETSLHGSLLLSLQQRGLNRWRTSVSLLSSWSGQFTIHLDKLYRARVRRGSRSVGSQRAAGRGDSSPSPGAAVGTTVILSLVCVSRGHKGVKKRDWRARDCDMPKSISRPGSRYLKQPLSWLQAYSAEIWVKPRYV